MAYGEAAKRVRLCTGLRKDGGPCQAYAMWRDPLQRCVTHAGRHHTGTMRSTLTGTFARRQRARYWPCSCAAYGWPHRPGGGLCRWPELPQYQCRLPAGTSWRESLLRY